MEKILQQINQIKHHIKHPIIDKLNLIYIERNKKLWNNEEILTTFANHYSNFEF